MSTSLHAAGLAPSPPPTLAGINTKAHLRYIARQPILARDQQTFGYELLFRSGPENFFNCDAPEMATCSTIDFSLISDAEVLTAGLPAFINCTRDILRRDIITVLPCDRVVIEVLEDVIADDETITACERLRRTGYQVALDDYVPNSNTVRLLRFADMVKVDFLATDAARQAAIAADMRRRGIKLIAEKVESREQFDLALRLGYHYFQGYFFCKPQTITMVDVTCSKLAYLRVLSIASRNVYDVTDLENAILLEPSLCYRLLRYLNSAAFGLFPIRSIRHALSMLGRREIRKWITIVVAIAISSDRPGELILNALTRARMCESLASMAGEDANEAFMVGIMSLMDAVLDRPMSVVLAQLPLASECKEALLGGDDALGGLLHLAVCCERGAWEAVSAATLTSTLSEPGIWGAYREACKWSHETLQQDRKCK